MGEDRESARMQLPIACELTGRRLNERRAEISRDLFAGCEELRALEDGYEYVFPGGEEWIEKLARFVAAERECCRFLAFEIHLQPDMGGISLRMRGPAGTREFLAGHFDEEFASKHAIQMG